MDEDGVGARWIAVGAVTWVLASLLQAATAVDQAATAVNQVTGAVEGSALGVFLWMLFLDLVRGVGVLAAIVGAVLVALEHGRVGVFATGPPSRPPQPLGLATRRARAADHEEELRAMVLRAVADGATGIAQIAAATNRYEVVVRRVVADLQRRGDLAVDEDNRLTLPAPAP